MEGYSKKQEILDIIEASCRQCECIFSIHDEMSCLGEECSLYQIREVLVEEFEKTGNL